MKPILSVYETRELMSIKTGDVLKTSHMVILDKLPVAVDYTEVLTADHVHWLAEKFGYPKEYLDAEIFFGGSELAMRKFVRMSETDIPTRDFHWARTDAGVMWEGYDRIEAYTTWQHSEVDDSIVKIYAARFSIIGNTGKASITNRLLRAYELGKAEVNDDYGFVLYEPEEDLLTIWGCQFTIGGEDVMADFHELIRITFDDTFLVDGILDVPKPGHIICYVEGLDNDSEW